jgi:hypothetical protein
MTSSSLRGVFIDDDGRWTFCIARWDLPIAEADEYDLEIPRSGQPIYAMTDGACDWITMCVGGGRSGTVARWPVGKLIEYEKAKDMYGRDMSVPIYDAPTDKQLRTEVPALLGARWFKSRASFEQAARKRFPDKRADYGWVFKGD